MTPYPKNKNGRLIIPLKAFPEKYQKFSDFVTDNYTELCWRANLFSRDEEDAMVLVHETLDLFYSGKAAFTKIETTDGFMGHVVMLMKRVRSHKFWNRQEAFEDGRCVEIKTKKEINEEKKAIRDERKKWKKGHTLAKKPIVVCPFRNVALRREELEYLLEIPDVVSQKEHQRQLEEMYRIAKKHLTKRQYFVLDARLDGKEWLTIQQEFRARFSKRFSFTTLKKLYDDSIMLLRRKLSTPSPDA